jgi:hypothetical protein
LRNIRIELVGLRGLYQQYHHAQDHADVEPIQS